MKLNSTQKLVLTEILKDLNDEARQDYDFSTFEAKRQFMLKQIGKFIEELADNSILK